jgi:hypothetical protein
MSNFKRIPKKALSWEAEIEGSIKYQSDHLKSANQALYLHRRRSWLSRTAFFAFPASGKSINQLFKDRMFLRLLPKKFRTKYNIPKINH